MTDTMWTMYVIRCRDGTYYTGITLDLAKRIARHNRGTAAKYTSPKTRRPVKLVYTRRVPGGKGFALQMEAEFKKLSRAKKDEIVKQGVWKKYDT